MTKQSIHAEYLAATAWLEEVPKYGHKDGLNNMARLMDVLQHPERKLHVIHVAGTNGKGSCSAMLERILSESGYRTGLYTSPHLVRYTERMRIGREEISEADFVRLLRLVQDANDSLVAQEHPHATFFEFLTCMAFLWFAEQETDYVVLEVGVGGRLDATNIVEKPLCCLITSISLDHTKVLGSTTPEIAAEKAGIMKPDVPVVTAKNSPEVEAVFRTKAAEKGCPWIPADADPSGYKLALVGTYQQDNAAAVLTVVRVLRAAYVPIPEEAVQKGLATVFWPGRMQKITWRGTTFLLEGAHNPDAAALLGEYLAALEKPVTVILGVLAKKDAKGVVDGLLRGRAGIGKILLCPIADEECVTPTQFREMVPKDLPWQAFDSAKEAAEAALSETEAVVCGSLYLVGELLKWME